MRTSLALLVTLAATSFLAGCSKEEPKQGRAWSCATVSANGREALRCTSSALTHDGEGPTSTPVIGGGAGSATQAPSISDGVAARGPGMPDNGGGGLGVDTDGAGGSANSGNAQVSTDSTSSTGTASGGAGSSSASGPGNGSVGGGSGGSVIHYLCRAGAIDCPPAGSEEGTNVSTDGTGSVGTAGGGAGSANGGNTAGAPVGGAGSSANGGAGTGDGVSTAGGSNGGSGSGSEGGDEDGDEGENGSTGGSGSVTTDGRNGGGTPDNGGGSTGTGNTGTGGARSGEQYECVSTNGQTTCTKLPEGSTPVGGGTTSASTTGGGCGRLLVIDEDSIDNGLPPNFFSDVDVNDHIAEIGLRKQLPYFAANVGKEITLHTGQVGDEGWFAPKVIPESWAAAGPTNNGITNFWGAQVGPGLGAPDAKGDREAFLDKVPLVTPLRAKGLKMLEGKSVCAVVYDSDVSINYSPLNGNLKGANLGIVAFEVLSVTKLDGYSTSSLPKVRIRILDAGTACGCPPQLFLDAPEPETSSIPMDVAP